MTGGGSGGHITPLLSLAHALKKASPNCRVIYIGLKGDVLTGNLEERYRIFEHVYKVSSGKFRRYHGESLLTHIIDVRTLVLNGRDFFRVLAGIKTARKVLKKVQPDIVFSKGGFVAVPVCLAARTLSIPIVTHDSDIVPGLANRIIGRFARLHTTGLPATYYDYPNESTRYTGIPIDERIKPVTKKMQADFKKQLGLPADSLVLLVGGAGLGARDVNNKVLAIAPDLLGHFPNLHIVHIAGKLHAREVAQKYSSIAAGEDSRRITVLDFTPDFYKYTGAADVIITRAGATTIAELATQRKAVVLIPAPHLAGGHQLENAEIVKSKGAAEVVNNDEAPEKLLNVISTLLKDESARDKLGEALGLLAKTDAADELAELLLKVADENR